MIEKPKDSGEIGFSDCCFLGLNKDHLVQAMWGLVLSAKKLKLNKLLNYICQAVST